MSVEMTVLLIVCLISFVSSTIASTIIVRKAFQLEVNEGILTLCVPFYIVYFSFVKLEINHKKALLAIWIGGGVIYMICLAVGIVYSVLGILDSKEMFSNF